MITISTTFSVVTIIIYALHEYSILRRFVVKLCWMKVRPSV